MKHRALQGHASGFPMPYGPHALAGRYAVADGGFVRGFVTGACLTAVQDGAFPTDRADLQRILRRGLQAGTAMAAGTAAASALRNGDYAGVLIAAGAGAAGVLLVERLLRDPVRPSEEENHGQEA